MVAPFLGNENWCGHFLVIYPLLFGKEIYLLCSTIVYEWGVFWFYAVNNLMV